MKTGKKGRRKKIQANSGMMQQFFQVIMDGCKTQRTHNMSMVTAGFPVRRARKPLLKNSQMNVTSATSNSDSERQLFYCFDNYPCSH